MGQLCALWHLIFRCDPDILYPNLKVCMTVQCLSQRTHLYVLCATAKIWLVSSSRSIAAVILAVESSHNGFFCFTRWTIQSSGTPSFAASGRKRTWWLASFWEEPGNETTWRLIWHARAHIRGCFSFSFMYSSINGNKCFSSERTWTWNEPKRSKSWIMQWNFTINFPTICQSV